MKELFLQHKKWVVALGVLMAVALTVAFIRNINAAQPKLAAPPPSEDEVTFDMEANDAYTAEDGVVIIPASPVPVALNSNVDDTAIRSLSAISSSSPDTVWTSGETLQSKNYTLPEQAQMANGSIGILSIPKLSLSVNVYETDDEMEAMTKGLAHFKTTSSWEGNVGICGHNQNFDLTDGYFKLLHTLQKGDTLSYKTALGERTYQVSVIKEVAASDWSNLNRSEDNLITMVTCISGKPNSRLIVQAIEKTA